MGDDDPRLHGRWFLSLSPEAGLGFAKRLEDGIFRWPKIEDGVMRLSAAQLSALLEGLDWRRVHEARETATPTQPG
jgi:transposase